MTQKAAAIPNYGIDINRVRQQANSEAQSSEEIIKKEEAPPAPTQSFVNKELKEIAYRRLLNRIRQQLSLPDRLLSYFIHQTFTNYASETIARTVGRPSGLLGSGLAAFGGSLIYYGLSKYYEQDYNFAIPLLILPAGFVAGLVVEVLWRLRRARKI